MIHISLLSIKEWEGGGIKILNKMSSRISQKNRGGERSCLNLSLWKHLATLCVLPECSTLWILKWAHSIPRTHHTPGPSHPPPWRTSFPSADLRLAASSTAAICLVWEASNFSLKENHTLISLWGSVSPITQPQSSAQESSFSAGSSESEEIHLILKKVLWSNCVNVIEMYAFANENVHPL